MKRNKRAFAHKIALTRSGMVALGALSLAFFGSLVSQPAQAQTSILKAQGNPYLVDFMILSSKRIDLRMEMYRSGMDAAFSAWLQREKPLIYETFLPKSDSDPKREAAVGPTTGCTCCPSPSR